jgi:GT2 family glycosyltransferase
MSKIAVVIPMFNKAELTRKCVELVKKNYGTGEPIEIVVVDDGSVEPFVDQTINVVRLDVNSGFTAAANEGILWAQYRNCDYVLLLNNDTEPYLGFLQELKLVLENNPDVGIAASVRIHPDKELDVELCGVDLIRGYQYFTKSAELPNDPMEANWIPLASGLLRMDMVREIGILNKVYRNHCSDSEYCLRAKLNHWKVMLVPTSKIIHHLSLTTTENKINPERDQALFLEQLACLNYAKLMQQIPLDNDRKSYGKLSFEVEIR